MRRTTEYWQRWEAAGNKLHSMPPEASDEEIIEAAADYLIAQGPYHGGKWHLSILNAVEPVEHDWWYKNLWGITTTDVERARAWISECMRLGHCVFVSATKHGLGGSPGSIKRIREYAALYTRVQGEGAR
jgi:hypothetical protein